jgi:pantoate--beta-alanine ligase
MTATVHTVTTIEACRAWRAAEDDVGLVPTMGFLHEGHLSLVRRAREECGRVAASIFVNPTQFGPGEDLASYPRDLARDLSLLASAGCDVAFVPTSGEMYPPGFETHVEVGAVASPLEGVIRPGHFRGVATVVTKLLNVVQPRRAYFGQKDAQQLAVIRRMARDLDMPVEIVGCPTVREPDGLAMSSRNTYLGPAEREAATVLYRALSAAREAWLGGERDAEELRDLMRAVLRSEPSAKTDYVSVGDPDSLRELDDVAGPAVVSMAVWIGRTRLIDNIVLAPATTVETGS